MIKEAVKAILKDKKMTQLDLANKLNVKQETISRTLSGNPTLKSITDIAEALEVDVIELFKGTSESLNGFVEYKGNVHRIHSSEDLEKLLSAVKKVD